MNIERGLDDLDISATDMTTEVIAMCKLANTLERSASCAHADGVCAFCYTIDLDHTPDHVVPLHDIV